MDFTQSMDFTILFHSSVHRFWRKLPTYLSRGWHSHGPRGIEGSESQERDARLTELQPKGLEDTTEINLGILYIYIIHIYIYYIYMGY